MPPVTTQTLAEKLRSVSVSADTKIEPEPKHEEPQIELTKAINNQYVNSAEEYLAKHNWERVGTDWRGQGIWSDPQGSAKPTLSKISVTLPSRERGSETIQQTCGTPAAWNYCTEEAVYVQRERNKHLKKVAV